MNHFDPSNIAHSEAKEEAADRITGLEVPMADEKTPLRAAIDRFLDESSAIMKATDLPGEKETEAWVEIQAARAMRAMFRPTDTFDPATTAASYMAFAAYIRVYNEVPTDGKQDLAVRKIGKRLRF